MSCLIIRVTTTLPALATTHLHRLRLGRDPRGDVLAAERLKVRHDDLRDPRVVFVVPRYLFPTAEFIRDSIDKIVYFPMEKIM